MLKRLVFLLFVLAGTSADYEVYTYFDWVHSGLDWKICCNSTFHTDEMIARDEVAKSHCEQLIPNDINCFLICCYNYYKTVYDPVTGFNITAFKEETGSATYTGEGSEWKSAIADDIIDECFEEIQIVPDENTPICNPDLRTYVNCYWNKMFQSCPQELKNEKFCLY